MSRPITASDRSALIRLASTLPKGSDERKAILASLNKQASGNDRFGPTWKRFHADLVAWSNGITTRPDPFPLDGWFSDLFSAVKKGDIRLIRHYLTQCWLPLYFNLPQEFPNTAGTGGSGMHLSDLYARLKKIQGQIMGIRSIPGILGVGNDPEVFEFEDNFLCLAVTPTLDPKFWTDEVLEEMILFAQTGSRVRE